MNRFKTRYNKRIIKKIVRTILCEPLVIKKIEEKQNDKNI